MKTILMPYELADKIIADARLPTADGKQVLPVNIENIRALIARAVTEDRMTETPDFSAIADTVLANYNHGETIMAARNAVVVALQYAQTGGARFKKAGVLEDDYIEAVNNAVEAFCTTLKAKGLWE